VKVKEILRETFYWTLVDQDAIQWQALQKWEYTLEQSQQWNT
jgi:hypothetical protein